MNIVSKNIIQRQILDVNIPNAGDHEEITTALSKVYKESIEEILENSCSGIIPANKVVRIDSLTVDLGHLSWETLEANFPKAVKNAVRELLFRKVRDAHVSLLPSEKASQKTAQEALTYYLSTGLLPWYYQGGLPKLKRAYAGKKNIPKEIFLNAFKNREHRKRAIYFFEEPVLIEFLCQELPARERNQVLQLKTLRSCLDKLATKKGMLKTRESQVAKKLWQSLQPKEATYSFIVEQFIRQLVKEVNVKKGKWLPALLPVAFRNRALPLLRRAPWKKTTVFSKDEIALMERMLVSAPERIPEVQTKIKNESEKYKVFGKFELDQQLESQADLSIQNAGLILVWPYLEAFFTGLGLMQEQGFVDTSAQVTAVHLLHYLVFKDVEGDETSWLLNKLLCGLDPSEFIPDTCAIDPLQKEECEHLLTAVIGNWPALKNTGADSLRQTFLQREGILAPCDNGWILKIERKAFDVLLDRLTWPISVVKIPWNDYLITTEW